METTTTETKIEKNDEGVLQKTFYLKNLLVNIRDYDNGPMKKAPEPHAHSYEQISYVAKGQLFVTIGNKKRYLRKGDVFYIPANTPHFIQTLSAHVRIVDSYSPVPEDLFIKKGGTKEK
ncbi:MAG: cupin domain-containing protein [Bacteroidales bacterium]|nr:cupin domain-containing protein [Bacteroidales bacterium]